MDYWNLSARTWLSIAASWLEYATRDDGSSDDWARYFECLRKSWVDTLRERRDRTVADAS